MKLTIDFETRSEINLIKSGPWVYAEHPSTDMLCLAVKVDNEPTGIFIPNYFFRIVEPIIDFETFPSIITPDLVNRLIDKADIIEAHNVMFERAIWEKVAVGKYSWRNISVDKLRCSAAKAAALALPRSLEGACEALDLPVKKDLEGRRIMLKLCKPRKPTKHNKAKWHESPEDLARLFRYCVQDVEAEYMLSENLPDLSRKEQIIWSIDQQINYRGIPVDLDAADKAIEIIKDHEITLLEEMSTLTGGMVSSPRQVAATLEWLKLNGVELPNLQKATVEAALNNGLPAPVRQVLRIRQSLGKSSTAKYQAFINSTSADGRARDTMMYHGASTGRWTGRRIQPHNMPRGEFKDTDSCIDLINGDELDMVGLLYGGPMRALSTCIRSTIKAYAGCDLICADFSSIEGRVLAWIAGEDHILRAYQAGKDLYKVSASLILGVPYDEITNDQRQMPGKVSELACGYQGGPGAARQFGAKGSDQELRDRIITPWRENRPATVQLWRCMEDCAIAAVRDYRNRAYSYNGVTWGCHKDFLHCKLPSGRMLSYYDPKLNWSVLIGSDLIYKANNLETEEAAQRKRDEWVAVLTRQGKPIHWSMVKESLNFMGINGYTRKWERQSTYGGKLVENIVQAVARDLMAEAIYRLEREKYRVVLHVHDEIVAEVKKDRGDLDQFCSIMAHVPPWAFGLPVAADGWRGERYKK